jgi:hypothetical protein
VGDEGGGSVEEAGPFGGVVVEPSVDWAAMTTPASKERNRSRRAAALLTLSAENSSTISSALRPGSFLTAA